MALYLSDNDSQVTLVAPTTLKYTLTDDDPSNTSFLDLSTSTGRTNPAYTVRTEGKWPKMITTVINAEAEVIASIEWRGVLPAIATIRNEPPMAFNSWMKGGLLPNSPVSFHDDQGRIYHWRNVAPGPPMELYADDTPGGPIAVFNKSRANRIMNTFSPATFIMTARAQEIAETCIVSFLFLEKKRR